MFSERGSGELEFEEYVARVTEFLDVPAPTTLDRDSGLYEDLGIDSLQAFELLIITEQLAGLSALPPSIPAIYTLGDAYDYYVASKARDNRKVRSQFEDGKESGQAPGAGS